MMKTSSLLGRSKDFQEFGLQPTKERQRVEKFKAIARLQAKSPYPAGTVLFEGLYTRKAVEDDPGREFWAVRDPE